MAEAGAAASGMHTGWRERLLLLALAWAVIGAGYSGTFFDMYRMWTTTTSYNHCFLIPPIALYMALQHRATLRRLVPSLAPGGLAMALAGSVLWLGGELMSIALFTHLAVVTLLIGSGWALLGNTVFRLLLFPFFYLYFSVPEGKFLVPYLQDWTAAVLVWLIQLTGIPVFIEGRYLTIPSGNFVVAEACSGINYLSASVAVGAMYMYLNYVSLWRRAAFMLLAIAVPLLANGVRAYGIVMIAHLSDYRYALGVDHFIYGWVFFGLVIFVLFAVGSRFSDVDSAAHAAGPAPAPAPEAAHQPVTLPRLALMMLALALCLFAPRAWVALQDQQRAEAPAVALPGVPGWAGPHVEPRRLGARFGAASSWLSARYVDAAGREVWLELAYFSTVESERELVNQTNRLYDAEHWKQLGYGSHVPAPGTGVADVDTRHLRHSADGREFLCWSWYEAGDVRSASRIRIKLAQSRARLRGAGAGAAHVSVLTASDDSDVDGAARTLEAFLLAARPALGRMTTAD